MDAYDDAGQNEWGRGAGETAALRPWARRQAPHAPQGQQPRPPSIPPALPPPRLQARTRWAGESRPRGCLQSPCMTSMGIASRAVAERMQNDDDPSSVPGGSHCPKATLIPKTLHIDGPASSCHPVQIEASIHFLAFTICTPTIS